MSEYTYSKLDSEKENETIRRQDLSTAAWSSDDEEIPELNLLSPSYKVKSLLCTSST